MSQKPTLFEGINSVHSSQLSPKPLVAPYLVRTNYSEITQTYILLFLVFWQISSVDIPLGKLCL